MNYQLTVVGQFAQAIVAQKVKENRFVICASEPNVEVSWQVTGNRQDAWAKATSDAFLPAVSYAKEFSDVVMGFCCAFRLKA